MQKYRAGFVDAKKGLIEARPLKNIFGWSLGAPTASQLGWEKGAIVVDVTNGIIYRNDGSATSATWVKLAAVGDTLTSLTVTTATLTTANITTANVTTLQPTKVNTSVGGSTAAAGSIAGDATALPAGTAQTYPVTAADDTKGVIVSSSDNVTGREIMVANLVSNKILKIYPPTGGTINGASANAAYSTASGKGALIRCTDATANTNAGAFAAIG